MPAPVASGWSDRRVGLAPTGKAPPCHGARGKRTLSSHSLPATATARNATPAVRDTRRDRLNWMGARHSLRHLIRAEAVLASGWVRSYPQPQIPQRDWPGEMSEGRV